jgi:peptidoglycan/LPS O-acetylase OafA/YrhL
VHLFDHLKISNWNLSNLWTNLPLFFMGTAFADMEFIKGWRPLDKLRDINIWLAVLRNITLLIIFFLWGSLNRYGCYRADDEQCPLFNAITINFYLPYWMAIYIGALAIFTLALLSPGFQWFLGSPPMQFLGKISYTLYLSHEWIIEWAMQDYYHHFRTLDKPAPEGREQDNFNEV